MSSKRSNQLSYTPDVPISTQAGQVAAATPPSNDVPTHRKKAVLYDSRRGLQRQGRLAPGTRRQTANSGVLQAGQSACHRPLETNRLPVFFTVPNPGGKIWDSETLRGFKQFEIVS